MTLFALRTYTERMDKTGRPVSPHITIYAWPTIALTSVMVRATGVMLTIGAGNAHSSAEGCRRERAVLCPHNCCPNI